MKCNQSSLGDRCPNPTTTNCIEWVGDDIPCLDICKGDSLTVLQNAIAEKLCELVALTDASNIVIPECLRIAWGTQDKEILTFLQFILDNACSLQSQIDSINGTIANFNPLVTVDYKCCSDNPCVTTGTVTLSVALQNIINCLCTQKEEIEALSQTVITNSNLVLSLQQQVQAQQNLTNSLITTLSQISVRLTNTENDISDISDRVDCIVAAGGFSC